MQSNTYTYAFLHAYTQHIIKMKIILNCFYVHYQYHVILDYKARKKNFGSGQLIFENWSGGPVELFSSFFSNLIFQQVLKLEIQIKLVLI